MTLTAKEVRDSFKYLFPDELPALQELVRSLPPNPFVINIGAGAGTSGLAIIQSRPDVTLFTIDITNESSPFGCLEAERDVFRRAGLANLFLVRWAQVLGDSIEVAESFGERILAYNNNVFAKRPTMVFVDGDHSYEHCKGDIEAWFPLIENGGIIAIHDYMKSSIPPTPDGPHPMPWPGVDRAVKEFYDNPEAEVIMHVDSLIAFRKVELPSVDE